MKKSLLSVTKSAIKFFFDIDPVITEHMIVQCSARAVLMQQDLAGLRERVSQRVRTIQLFRPQEERRQLTAA